MEGNGRGLIWGAEGTEENHEYTQNIGSGDPGSNRACPNQNAVHFRLERKTAR